VDAIRDALEIHREHVTKVGLAVQDSILKKLDAAAEVGVKSAAVTVSLAHRAMESVLGVGTVAMPRHADGAFFATMTRCIQKGKYTADDFTTAAEALRAKGWAPPYSFERAVYAMDRLLAASDGGLGYVHRGRPVDMDDL
jgi:hypothetical protein